MSDFFTRMLDSLTPAMQLLSLLSYVIPLLAALAAYVITGLALTALSRATGIGKTWMAWVPYANLYLPGLTADVYTDNRLTTPIHRSLPFYSPSDLRRRMLGYGLGSSLTGAIAAAATSVCLLLGAVFFFMLIGVAAGGDPADLPPFADVLFLVCGLLACASGIFCMIFTVLFLIAFCTAYHRLLAALQVPCPALWVALGILLPPILSVVLLLYVRRAEDLAAAFAPPPEVPETY